MGLAENVGGGRWQLAEDFEGTLRSLGERSDIIRTMQRELSARDLQRPWIGRSLFGAGENDPVPIVGRVIGRGLADEHRDRRYLLVDGVDGHAHYVDMGRGDAVPPMPEGAILRVSAKTLQVSDADRVVAEVAAANGRRYSTDLHLQHDPSATQSFAEAHVPTARRGQESVSSAILDGSWTIAPDHADRAATYEVRRHRDWPVEIETLSSRPIDQLPGADAAIWIDPELASKTPLLVRDSSFGRDVRTAMAGRRQWLIARQLADIENGQIRLRETALAVLQRRELLGTADDLAGGLGKPFAEARTGTKCEAHHAARRPCEWPIRNRGKQQGIHACALASCPGKQAW